MGNGIGLTKGSVRMEISCIGELQTLVNIMGYVSRDFSGISCLKGMAVVDANMKVLFCEDKEDLNTDSAGRVRVVSFLKDNPAVEQCVMEAMTVNEKRSMTLNDEYKVLAIPLAEKTKCIGAIVMAYCIKRHEGEECCLDVLVQDILYLLIVRYHNMVECDKIDCHHEKLRTMEDFERYAILATGNKFKWNISLMSKELGIGRNTLYSKMKKLKIVSL